MGSHITRSIVATVNLLLGGTLTYLWFLAARDTNFFGSRHDAGYWIILLAMSAMTLTAIGAAAHLVRRSTVEPGLKWNAAVGASWFLSAVGVAMVSFSDGRMYSWDAIGIAVLAGIGLLWLSFGWVIRYFLTTESRKLHSIPTRITATAETIHHPQAAQFLAVPSTTSIVPTQEVVQLLHKRQ